MRQVLFYACDQCGETHDPRQPHNVCSDMYCDMFYTIYGRLPTWDDAMSHCTDEMKKSWKDSMARVKCYTDHLKEIT